MTVLAASADNTVAPVVALIIFIVLGGLMAASLTVTIVRISRASQPREQQMARLAARLDGRSKVTIRMVEFSIGKADLVWVAQSRGYGLIEHQFGKYYEFFYAPQWLPPRPWSN